MEIRRTHSITSGKDMLGTDEKKQTKKKTHKRSLTCSNWSSFLQRFLHGDKTKGFGGWLVRAARRHQAFSCDESQPGAVSSEALKGVEIIWQFPDQGGGEKKRDFHEDIIADGMWYSCWTMTDACPVMWRPSWFWGFLLFFFLKNNATNVHIGGWIATVEHHLWKSSFQFLNRIHFRLIFHQNPTAVPCCFPFIVPTILVPSHLPFIDRGRGAVARWALWLLERTATIQRCIIDHTARSSSLRASAFFLLFPY